MVASTLHTGGDTQRRMKRGPIDNGCQARRRPERAQRGKRGEPLARALTALESCLEFYCSIHHWGPTAGKASAGFATMNVYAES